MSDVSSAEKDFQTAGFESSTSAGRLNHHPSFQPDLLLRGWDVHQEVGMSRISAPGWFI